MTKKQKSGTSSSPSPSEKEIREIFEHYDHDKNNTIDRCEFRNLTEALGGSISSEELAIGLSIVDKNNNGRIEFSEFLRWWNDR